jgi:putative transposase
MPVDSRRAAIDRDREKHAFDLWAYVVMPEHVHLLIWSCEPVYSISRMLTSIERPVSIKASSDLRQSQEACQILAPASGPP